MLKKFWIVTNDGKDTNHAVTGKVKELLEIAGRNCALCEKDAEKNIIREHRQNCILNRSKVPQKKICSISVKKRRKL